ncbi:MAG: oxidoreductase [Candidatus Omnitrophota bacterium]
MIDYMSKFSLNDKTVFVTGGAGLLGSEVCKAVASLGARLILLDVNNAKGEALTSEIIKNGFKASFEYFDISDIDNVEKNIIQLIQKFKNADVWVNAAYPRTEDWGASLENLKISSWRKNIDMHLNGYFFSAQKIAEQMKEQKRGSIINFASIYGIVAPDFYLYKDTKMTMPAAYSAIKGGIINFTKYLAAYYGKYNIRVNAVSPGGVYDNQPETFVSRYNEKTPLGRMANKEDIAGAVIYLASNASSYVTGHNLVVDGGWSVV